MHHLQIHGVRAQLRERGVAIRQENGDYILRHHDPRHTDTVRTSDLFAAYTSGLRMASNRDRANQFPRASHVR